METRSFSSSAMTLKAMAASLMRNSIPHASISLVALALGGAPALTGCTADATGDSTDTGSTSEASSSTCKSVVDDSGDEKYLQCVVVSGYRLHVSTVDVGFTNHTSKEKCGKQYLSVKDPKGHVRAHQLSSFIC